MALRTILRRNGNGRAATNGAVEFQTEEVRTARGVWRLQTSGGKVVFCEYTSNARLGKLPLVHYIRGRDLETRRVPPARGAVAIGQKAIGILAMGQFSFGLISFGQFSLGLLFGVGQFTTGLFALGQFAGGVLLATGQLSAAYVAIGQLGLGEFVLAQLGFGTHVWDVRGVDPAAKQFFGPLFD